jgi:hypothetical protein
MGQNSEEISYGFGQMGSAYMNMDDAPIFPPKGKVIVAIQFIRSNTLSVLRTETLDRAGPQFTTTEDDELASAGGPDANYLGVVEAPATSGTAAGVITLTASIAATNALIKPGQVIIVGGDLATIDAGFDSNQTNFGVDAAAGYVLPVYNGPNKAFLEVVSISGTTLTVRAVGACTTAALANIDTNNTIFFLDEFHGAGGVTSEGASYPTGIIIYGRWTEAQIGTEDADGGIICYFGY